MTEAVLETSFRVRVRRGVQQEPYLLPFLGAEEDRDRESAGADDGDPRKDATGSEVEGGRILPLGTKSYDQ